MDNQLPKYDPQTGEEIVYKQKVLTKAEVDAVQIAELKRHITARVAPPKVVGQSYLRADGNEARV